MDIDEKAIDLYNELQDYLEEARISLVSLINKDELYEFCLDYIIDQQISQAEFIRDDKINEGLIDDN